MSSRAKVGVGWTAGVGDMKQSNDLEDHLLSRAFDEAAIGMGLMSLEPSSAGRLLAVNPALAAITGHAPDDLVGSDALELVLPEGRADARRRLEQLIAREVRSLHLDDVVVG
jgi:PAS domain S-box-containing protein